MTEWQQYTGLKDKNGKEIYEGDIFQDKEGIWTIEWEDLQVGGFMAVKKEINSEKTELVYNFLPLVAHEGIVIGDIYRNPELIK